MSRQHRGRTIEVQNDNVQSAIKKLRRRLMQQKVLRTYMSKTHHTKQSYKKKKRKARKLFLSRLTNKLFTENNVEDKG